MSLSRSKPFRELLWTVVVSVVGFALDDDRLGVNSRPGLGRVFNPWFPGIIFFWAQGTCTTPGPCGRARG